MSGMLTTSSPLRGWSSAFRAELWPRRGSLYDAGHPKFVPRSRKTFFFLLGIFKGVAWARGSARCGEVCACARVWVRLCICPCGVFLLRDRRFDVANAFLSLQVLRRLLLVAFPLVFSAGLRLCVHRFVASVLFGVVVFFGGDLVAVATGNSINLSRW